MSNLNVNFIKNEYIVTLRVFLCHEDKVVKKLTLKLLRLMISLHPEYICKLYKHNYVHILISKLFEDFKYSSFDERLESYRLIMTWLKNYKDNFPLIFCQGLAALYRGQDELFKKGALEFIRELSISLPYYCKKVGGFKILVDAMLDSSILDYSECIINTIIFILNSSEHRYCLFNEKKDSNYENLNDCFSNGNYNTTNNINDNYNSNITLKKNNTKSYSSNKINQNINNVNNELFKMFSIFTKSEYAIHPRDRSSKSNYYMTNEERNKIEVQLELSKRFLLKLIKTWPGYCFVFGNFMVIYSIIQSLNGDASLLVKKTILELFKEILDLFDSGNIDDFRLISSENYANNNYNMFFLNKVYFAYIIQGLKSNLFYRTITIFIEKEDNQLVTLAKQIRMKFLLLYSKLSNIDILLPLINKNYSNTLNNNLSIDNSCNFDSNETLNKNELSIIGQYKFTDKLISNSKVSQTNNVVACTYSNSYLVNKIKLNSNLNAISNNINNTNTINKNFNVSNFDNTPLFINRNSLKDINPSYIHNFSNYTEEEQDQDKKLKQDLNNILSNNNNNNFNSSLSNNLIGNTNLSNNNLDILLSNYMYNRSNNENSNINTVVSSNLIGVVTDIDEELIHNNVKTMDLLDEKFQYFDQKDYFSFNNDLDIRKELSEPIVYAKEALISKSTTNSYSNQYTIEMAKKELFDLIDDNSFNSLIKSSNIFSKDYQEWDWKKIEEILDIAEYKSEFGKFIN